MAENEPTQSQTSQDSTPADSAAPSPASNKKLLGVLAAAVVVTIAVVFALSGGTDKKLQAAPMTFACATPDCGFTVIRALQLDETLPANCPKCGNKTLYCSRKCANCGTGVIMDEDRGQPGPTKCPKCGNEIRHGE